MPLLLSLSTQLGWRMDCGFNFGLGMRPDWAANILERGIETGWDLHWSILMNVNEFELGQDG